jgi:hypothetical protein
MPLQGNAFTIIVNPLTLPSLSIEFILKRNRMQWVHLIAISNSLSSSF